MQSSSQALDLFCLRDPPVGLRAERTGSSSWHMNAMVRRLEKTETGQLNLVYTGRVASECSILADVVLLATGRTPNTSNVGLQVAHSLGTELHARLRQHGHAAGWQLSVFGTCAQPVHALHWPGMQVASWLQDGGRISHSPCTRRLAASMEPCHCPHVCHVEAHACAEL